MRQLSLLCGVPGQILKQLEEYTKFPDFNNYLAYIFAEGGNAPVEVRLATCPAAA